MWNISHKWTLIVVVSQLLQPDYFKENLPRRNENTPIQYQYSHQFWQYLQPLQKYTFTFKLLTSDKKFLTLENSLFVFPIFFYIFFLFLLKMNVLRTCCVCRVNVNIIFLNNRGNTRGREFEYQVIPVNHTLQPMVNYN